MMKKGFTLMEILAVLLILAVVASFAVPVIRSVRADIRYQSAKSSALKMAEAIRSYYTNTKGYKITGSVGGRDVFLNSVSSSSCTNPSATGIPSTTAGETVAEALFHCGYLNVKDFKGLPYVFESCSPFNAACGPETTKAGLVQVYVLDNSAGTKYAGLNASGNRAAFTVNRDMTITENPVLL